MSKILREIPVEKQIARHMQRWERRREEWQRQWQPSLRPAPKLGGPYISFSRELGSGGNELAAAVAAKMKWQLYDRAIIEAIATRTHVREELVARFDEHVQSAFDTYMRNLFTHQVLDSTQYLHHLTKVLLSVAQYGEAVIVGRGAHLILPPRGGLRVRVTAPWEMRMQRMREERGGDERRAAKALAAHDREQREFLQRHFNCQPDDVRTYDIVINLGHLSLEIATNMVAQLAEAKLGNVGARN